MSELFKQLSDDMSTLVRQELRLAQAEMTQKGKEAGLGVGMFGAAGILGLTAFFILTACVIAALATGIAVWLATLIVAVVYGAVAAVLGVVGKERVSQAAPPIPQQTVQTVKEDVQWAKTQLPSDRK
jgi:apolipoprotein N-acyltransferase